MKLILKRARMSTIGDWFVYCALDGFKFEARNSWFFTIDLRRWFKAWVSK